MEKKIALYLALILFCINISLKGQRIIKGQTLPEIISTNVNNINVETISLSKFKGKFLLLEFWSFNCSSCFKAFPKLDQWQKKYSEKLQIILVNSESKENTLGLFKKFKASKINIPMPELPMITNDQVLNKLFLLKGGFPHVIWIDNNNIFRYQTGSFTEEQLIDFIYGRKPDLVEKMPKEDFISKASLIEQLNKDYLKDIRSYSYIAHYLPSTTIGNFHFGTFNNNPEMLRISESNGSLLELLRIAFSERFEKYNFSWGINIELICSDTSRFLPPDKKKVGAIAYLEWARENLWRYDCALPKKDKIKLYSYMQQDLCRFFDLSAYVEKRKVKALALVLLDSNKLSENKQDVSEAFERQQAKIELDSIFFIGSSLKFLFTYVQTNLYQNDSIKLPLVDETGYSGNVYMSFPRRGNLGSVDWWRKQLNRFGIDISMMETESDIFVIKEHE